MIPISCFYAASTLFFLRNLRQSLPIAALLLIYLATCAYGWWKTKLDYVSVLKKAVLPTLIFVLWLVPYLIPVTRTMWNFVGDSVFIIGLFTMGYVWALKRDLSFKI